MIQEAILGAVVAVIWVNNLLTTLVSVALH